MNRTSPPQNTAQNSNSRPQGRSHSRGPNEPYSAKKIPWYKQKDYQALMLFAIVMVFLKKWEAGGNIDAIWYSLVPKNIVDSGNFFRFSISEFFYSSHYDHFPMTYWTIAGLYKLFGVSDFVARLYPMVCSVFTIVLLFSFADKLKNRTYAFISLLLFALCFASSKWLGAVKQDVPLATYFLASSYFFLKGRIQPKNLYWFSFFLTCGVFTKGPIIMAVLGCVGLFLLFDSASRKLWREPHFYGAFLLLVGLLAIPFFPPLHFEGRNYYSVFYDFKKSYLALSAGQGKPWYFYFEEMFISNPLVAITWIVSVLFVVKNSFSKNTPELKSAAKADINLNTSWYYFALLLMVATIVPLSIFQVKFSYYMLPLYPFLAITAAPIVFRAFHKKSWNWGRGVYNLALFALIILACFPIKTTGARPKEVTNLIKWIQMDENLTNKTVLFLGGYETDMSIFQEFKFYGDVDLVPSNREIIAKANLSHSFIVAPIVDLPVKVGAIELKLENCFVKNSKYCLLTDADAVRYVLPDNQWPEEVYYKAANQFKSPTRHRK